MKRTTAIAIFAALAFISAGMSVACAYTLFVHRGSEFTGTLTGALGSRVSRTGDPVALEMRGAGIPAGSLLRGRVERVSPFSPGHAAAVNVVLTTLDVPGEAPVRVAAHVLGITSPRKSAFSRIRGGFQLISGAEGDLLLKKGTRVRLQAAEDIRVSDEAPARVSYPKLRTPPAHEPPPPQGTHPYDAGGEMPY